MPDDPKYLYRIQHDKSFSKYVVGTGVVATHHNPEYRDIKAPHGDPLVDRGNKKASGLDLLNHLHYYSTKTTSFISTSSSLEFAIYYSHDQHLYGHTGIQIFVIDVEKVKRRHVLYAIDVLGTLQHSRYAALYSEESLEKRRNYAKSFDEWIVTVLIPDSAIIRILPYEIVFELKPDWYPPSRVPVFQDEIKRYAFKQWKMDAKRKKEDFTQHQQKGQVIKFIKELAKDVATDWSTFAKHAFTELSEGMSSSFIDETLVELSSIKIGALPRTSEQDTRSLIANEDASSESTSSSGSDDQGYPESVSDSASDLGLEKTLEKLTLEGKRFLSTR